MHLGRRRGKLRTRKGLVNDIYNMIEESPNRLILDTATADDKDVNKTTFII